MAGMTQWIECWPVNQKVTCSIPSEGTCLGNGPGPQLGAWERQLIDVFDASLAHQCFSFSLPSPLPKNKVNKIFKK